MKTISLKKWRENRWMCALLNIIGDEKQRVSDDQLLKLAQDEDALTTAAEYEMLWAKSSQLELDDDLSQVLLDCEESIAAETQPHTARNRLLPVSIAACCLVAIVALFSYQAMPSGYSTQIGEQRVVVLEDGTRVTLNTDTKIDVKLGAVRLVRLIKGEGYFDVAHDIERPFIVETSAGRTQALGTEFSVRINNDSTMVTVVEGSVSVTGANAAAKIPTLSPGESVTLLSDGTPTPKETVDTTAIRYWREGKVYFEDERLDNSVTEFNRYLDRKLIISTKELNDLRIGGIFQASDVDAFLFALGEAYDVEAITSPNAIILVKR